MKLYALWKIYIRNKTTNSSVSYCMCNSERENTGIWINKRQNWLYSTRTLYRKCKVLEGGGVCVLFFKMIKEYEALYTVCCILDPSQGLLRHLWGLGLCMMRFNNERWFKDVIIGRIETTFTLCMGFVQITKSRRCCNCVFNNGLWFGAIR